MPERHQRFEALVLKIYPIGDRHRGLVVLTRERGLLSLIAHGAEGPKSRWRGLVAPLRRIRLSAYHDPVHDSWKVEEVEDVRLNEGLSGDPDRFFAASRWSEIALKTHGGIEGEFDLLDEALDSASRSSGEELHRLELQFLWRLADLAGLKPDFLQCDGCGRPLSGVMVEFRPDPVSALCPSCAEGGGWTLEPKDVDYLTATSVYSLAESLEAPLTAERTRLLRAAAIQIWKSVLGNGLSTFS